MKTLRLISQDGGTCIPYDNYALEIRKVNHNDKSFYFIDAINTLNSNDKKYPMGMVSMNQYLKILKQLEVLNMVQLK